MIKTERRGKVGKHPGGGVLPRMVSFQNSLHTGRAFENLSFLPLVTEGTSNTANPNRCQNLKVVCLYTFILQLYTVNFQMKEV